MVWYRLWFLKDLEEVGETLLFSSARTKHLILSCHVFEMYIIPQKSSISQVLIFTFYLPLMLPNFKFNFFLIILLKTKKKRHKIRCSSIQLITNKNKKHNIQLKKYIQKLTKKQAITGYINSHKSIS